MNESTLERLCTSRHRWLIVTGVTFLIALVSVLPQVDQLLAERTERAELLEQLAQANRTAEELPLYEQRVAEKTAELQQLRELEVDEADLTTLRSWLVDIARQAGCQVRRIDLSAPNTRAWTKDGNPLETTKKTTKDAATPFELRTRSVTFSVTGTTLEVRALLKTLDKDRRLKHAHAVAMKPQSRNRNELQLDLTLWYFALAPRGGVA